MARFEGEHVVEAAEPAGDVARFGGIAFESSYDSYNVALALRGDLHDLQVFGGKAERGRRKR